MSQRLTGERQRRILGIAKNGQPIHWIGGSDPEEQEGQPNGDSGAGTGQDSSGNEGGDPNLQGTGAPAGTDNPRVYTQDEIDALTRRMQAADKNAATLQEKLKQFEDKDKTELEKATRDLQEQQRRAEAAEKELLKVRLHNKFLASNKYEWHDPETALALLDTSEVVVEEGGKVVGLEEAMNKLAKAKPFLLKGKESGGGSNGGGRPSGSQPPANGGKGNKDAQEREALKKKYPALSR